MKKIVFVISQLYGGGAERVTAALVNEMCKDRTLEMHLITYKQDENKDYFVDKKIIRHTMEMKEDGRIGAIFSRIAFLKNTIAKIDPCCVISLDGPRVVTLLTMSMIGSKIPLILSERNAPDRYPETKVLRAMRNFSYTLCDGIVFQTNEAKEYFPFYIKKKGIVISNPITGNLPTRFEGIREPRIVNYCRLDSQKNLDLLIDSFADIADDFPHYTLHLYGDGPEKSKLERKIQEMKLSEKVILHGYSECIYDEILKASLFVSSSNYEGISNSMLEAISLGIPSICTDCPAGGARETIINGVNGILVPTGNKTEMTKAMKKVLSDEKLATAMSKEGNQLREKISVNAITQQWIGFINEITG